MVRYPWKSLDASTIHVAGRFGELCTPWGRLKINKNLSSAGLNWSSEQNEVIIKQWANNLLPSIDYDCACQQTPEATEMRTMINILYYEQLNKDIPVRFKNQNKSSFKMI